jgi:hypothetical protein
MPVPAFTPLRRWQNLREHRLFLPFVNLQADKVWKLKADQGFLRNYRRVHILLGWILVPLVLAAQRASLNNEPEGGNSPRNAFTFVSQKSTEWQTLRPPNRLLCSA